MSFMCTECKYGPNSFVLEKKKHLKIAMSLNL